MTFKHLKGISYNFLFVFTLTATLIIDGGVQNSAHAADFEATTSPLTLSRDMQVGEKAAKPDASCALSPADPYERPHRIGLGSKKYAQQCVDTDRFRFSEILKQTKSEWTFSNYRHQNEYWTATLGLNTIVEHVFFQVVRFEAISGVIAAHTQIRLKFSNQTPLKLQSQLDPQKTTESLDLVISFEASRPVGTPYNFALGAVDNYVSVARILSGAQRLAESTENITEQYELSIPQDEKLHIALLALEKSARDGFVRFYNTISENCTTDAFAILDSLNFLKGKVEPFLTVLSNDPVAGPSIRGLKQRQILKARFADLHEELEKGISSYKPEVEFESRRSGFLPYIKDHPYSLVLATPEEQSLTDAQRVAVEAVQALTYEAVPRALHLLGSSLMLAQGDSRDFLFTFLNEAGTSLRQRLQKINATLPDQPVEVVAYLVPWSGGGKKINLNDVSPIQARLPFDFYQVRHKDLGLISSGVAQATQTQSIPELGLQAYAMALQFYLKKDAWSVSLQVLGGLNERQEALAVANSQVNIQSFVIPKPRKAYEQPVVLLNMTLTPDTLNAKPKLNMEFGTFGGLKARLEPKAYGQLSVMTGGYCDDRLSATPRLEGLFAEEATGYSVIDYIFSGKFVSFNIFKVDLDLQTQKITDMDVRFNFSILGIPISCLSQDKVNDSFIQSANEQLETLVQSLKSTDTTPFLTPVVDKVLSQP